MTILSIFLLVNGLLIGSLATIAVRHAYRHFRPHPDEPQARAEDTAVRLPAATKKALLEAAAVKYAAALERSGDTLNKDLETTAATLSRELESLGNKVLEEELHSYKTTLDQLVASNQAMSEAGKKELAESYAALKAQLKTDIDNEKAALLAQIDTKLSDAVMSWLLESLGHDVDLGAQGQYLVRSLEEHKADIRKAVGSES